MRDAPFVLDVRLPLSKSYPVEGDVVIEGFCADFSEDRQGERFLPGAFDEAVKKATVDQIPLLLEHDNRKQLGVVEKLEVREEGLWTRARIAAPLAGTRLENDVNQIRRGMKRGLSVRGLVKIKDGMIAALDLAEISVTPVPVQPGALFAVATKSLEYAGGTENDIAWAARGQLEPPAAEVQKAAYAYMEESLADAAAVLAELRTQAAALRGSDGTA